jgi:cytochrome c peroxidase
MRSRSIGFCTLVAAAAAVLTVLGTTRSQAASPESRQLVFRNASGIVRTLATGNVIDLSNPFFQSLGTNGRSCATCHAAEQGWTITPEGVQARFRADATDPIFRNNDGSNCEGALPGSPEEQSEAYSLLLTRGLIRVGLDLPADAEFTIDSVTDPYNCGVSSNDVSVYRRPLPSTNLRFLSAVMWDGRESSASSSIEDDLLQQAKHATSGHAQAFIGLKDTQARQIVEFESGLHTTQAFDNEAGTLTSEGAGAGPGTLAAEPFFLGINDPLGFNPTRADFTPNVFTLFDGWAALPGTPRGPVAEARRAIARGQQIFNTKTFLISGVGGLNGETFSNGATPEPSFRGTCTICHDSPNVGNHSVKAPLDLGLTAPAVAPYLPVYHLRKNGAADTIDTTDPGRALITGKWRDVNRFKGPVLRGLAARAPYFHNGSAATLDAAVEFYDTRFNIGLTAREKADLVAFLRSL